MKQIYTKTGDKGSTSLKGGTRVPKDDLRIETNGLIDLMNSCLGFVRASCTDSSEREFILSIQKELMVIMSHIATPKGVENNKILHCKALVMQMEQIIDNSTSPAGFVIPGENLLSSLIHIARSTTRIVEIKVWKLAQLYNIDKDIPVFFNRLSDYLFILAIKYSK